MTAVRLHVWEMRPSARPALRLVDRVFVLGSDEIRLSGAPDEIREEVLAEEYL
jgi:branched-chain amino acid transport system ATP-binding protein